MSAQTAADLRAAADILRRDGWTQLRLHDEKGCHCVSGALIKAITGRNTSILAEQECARHVAAQAALASVVGTNVIAYNDAEDRTQDEVIAALEAAADTAEKA